jgi:cytochrome c-type biogenesis protein CcmH/NrfG/TolB-like protein
MGRAGGILAFTVLAWLLTPPVSRAAAIPTGRVVWVTPFENHSPAPGFDWISISFPNILNARLGSAGFLTIRRMDQRYAMQHLGMPADFHPTLATTFRIAQTLDAQYVVIGSYSIAAGQITATARLLRISNPAMPPPIEVHGPLNQLIDLENKLAWRVADAMDPTLAIDEQTFIAAGHNLRLDAFESYIRGEAEEAPQQQIDRFSHAVQLSPDYTQAWFALGRAYFDNQQYEESVAPFARVPRSSREWLEAQFYSGLAHLYTGGYTAAQSEFASIAAVLPMPGVLNNEGIAINRSGQNGTGFFERVVQLDPQNADYWFNLAVSQRRQKDYAAALKAAKKSLGLRPHDEEARHLIENLDALASGKVPAPQAAKPSAQPANASAAGSTPAGAAGDTSPADAAPAEAAPVDSSNGDTDYEPLERIARSWDESSFRQAAFAMEQINAIKLQSMPPRAQANLLCQRGTHYVNEGLILQAQRQFQLSLKVVPENACALAGMSQVHDFSGNAAAAEHEAKQSIAARPNAAAYVVLARVALQKRSYADAQSAVDHALQLDPKNSAALGLQKAIAAQGQAQ